MTDLVVLGFASRELAEEARRRGAALTREGALDLDGAALAHRLEDGRVELVQPLSLAGSGAAKGGLQGGLIGALVLAPLIGAAVGAASGAAGAGISAGILNAKFVREVRESLQPGRAALFLVVAGTADPAATVEALGPLSPQVLRSTLSEDAEKRLVSALAQHEGG